MYEYAPRKTLRTRVSGPTIRSFLHILAGYLLALLVAGPAFVADVAASAGLVAPLSWPKFVVVDC